MSPRNPTRRQKLGLALGGALIGLLLAEISIRLMKPGGGEFLLEARIGSIPPDLYQPDPQLKTVLRPQVKVSHQSIEYQAEIRTNSLGIRGPEVTEKADQEIRILAIGDSFTLGIQVEENETASARLAQSLRTTWDRPVSAWNAGVDGYGTLQATELARRLAPELKPDLILLRFYLGNDLRDNAIWSGAREAPLPVEPEGGPGSETWNGIHRSLAKWSRLYAYLLAWNATRNAASDPRVLEMGDEVRPFVDAESRLELLPPTQAALQQMAALCSELAVPCIVSWVPPAHAVHTDRAPATFEIFGLDAQASDPEALQTMVASVLPRSIISCDPGPALREAADNQALYYVFDPHWNAEGHRIAAESEAACIHEKIGPDSF